MRRKRSILFVRPDYHCSFFYRDELRKLGWQADILVDPAYPDGLLYSSKDILRPPRLPAQHLRLCRWLSQLMHLFLYLAVFWKYRVHVYYGRPPVVDCLEAQTGLTKLFGKDFLVTAWLARAVGCKLVFVPTGCHDDDTKADWQLLDDGNVCNNCGFFDRCNDRLNHLNFSRIRRYFDFSVGFGCKNSRQLAERHFKYKAIDLALWSPALEVPPEHRLPPTSNFRILHSAYLKGSSRAWQGRNIKGSPFVLEAIERLRKEGYPVEYMYIENKPSNQMRFYQVQADVVVEQLIYGWWGSTGVETMALGKPVVCYLRPAWKDFFLQTFPEYSSLPIVEADTTTIYDVLKKLVMDPELRASKGAQSRRFAEMHFDPARNARAFAEVLESL